MTWFATLLIGFLTWGVLFWHLDRPSEPAWKVRNIYRGLNILLVFLLLTIGWKASLWRQELRWMIQNWLRCVLLEGGACVMRAHLRCRWRWRPLFRLRSGRAL